MDYMDVDDAALRLIPRPWSWALFGIASVSGLQ
jgi:hypothetical protein